MRRPSSPYGKVKTRPVRKAPPAVRGLAKSILSDVARKTKYLDPALAARWPDFTGEELAKISRPGRMIYGEDGRIVEVIVATGAAATRIQMAAESIKDRLNQHLGPNADARISIRQSAPGHGKRREKPEKPRISSRFFNWD